MGLLQEIYSSEVVHSAFSSHIDSGKRDERLMQETRLRISMVPEAIDIITPGHINLLSGMV